MTDIGGECACGKRMLASEQELDSFAEKIRPYLNETLARYLARNLTESFREEGTA